MDWYLPAAGLLVGLGVVLLLAEFFVPTGGVTLVVGVACFAGAVGLLWLFGSTLEAVVATLGLSLGLPVAASVMFAGWRRLSLKSALDADNVDTTVGDLPEIAELESLRGMTGKTLSPMRPAGIVQLDGRRIDAVSQGAMIDAGEWVKCVEVRGATVVVRRLDRQPDLNDLAVDEL